MFQGLRKHFAENAARRQSARVFEAKMTVALDALNNKDYTTFDTIRAGLQDAPQYQIYGRETLLVRALQNDDPVPFLKVLGEYKDPNVMLTDMSTVAAAGYRGSLPVVMRRDHILGLAIERGKESVALALISDSRVSVASSGVVETHYSVVRPDEKQLPTPLELARRNGLTRVVKALESRAAREQQPYPTRCFK